MGEKAIGEKKQMHLRMNLKKPSIYSKMVEDILKMTTVLNKTCKHIVDNLERPSGEGQEGEKTKGRLR